VRSRFIKSILFVVAISYQLLAISFKVQAQVKQHITTRVLFIFDASYSMSDTWQKNVKIDFAKQILTEIIDSIRNVPDLQMGLRTLGADYSLYPERNCQDTRLLVPFEANNALKIEYAIKGIEPRGTTPIAYTLEKCADDFTPCDNCHDVIILITDGIEECGGDPCEAAKALHAKGINLRPFIIGIGNEDFSGAYSCVGKFFDVKQEENFKNILKIVISQALNNTTAQVNLIDAGGKPTETDVAMTFYDQATGRRIYNFMHTINDYGNPDTIYLDPNITYHLVVHTIPEVEKDNVTLTPGKHNIIALDAPQGYLHFAMDGENDYKSLAVLVKKHDDDNTLNVQYVESTEKYIAGKYDLEILTLPRIYENGIKVSQSSTTTVTIASAGVVTINKLYAGPGSIYEDDGGKMIWVCNLDNNTLKQLITLQPGNYHVVYRPQDVKQTIFTIDNSFKIESGLSTVVNLE
jgi:Ca-activated chloride channel homolog